jgi:hypothetical protein
MKKLLISTFAAAVMLLFGGVNEVNGDPLTYITGDGKAAVVDCDGDFSGELIIPSTIDGKTVTSIRQRAFYNCRSLTSVTIPDSVTSIERGAFYNCSSLASVTIPDSVAIIKEDTFFWCTSLASVTIPDSVTSIGDGAFLGCSSLTRIFFEGNAPEIFGGRPDPLSFWVGNPFRKVSPDAQVIVYPGATGFGEIFRDLPVIIQGKLEIVNTSKSDSPFTISFESKSGSTYIIEVTQDFKQWSEIGEAQGTGSSVKFTDPRLPIVPFKRNYFRVKLVE